VVVYEDLARQRQLTLRWWGGTNWKRKALGRALDRDRTGEPTTKSSQWAINEATIKSATLVQGASDVTPAAPVQPFTVGETVAAITHPETGRYPHDTDFRRELTRALDYASVVWGKDTAWSEIDDAAWTKLIRRRLESLLLRGKKGVRTTEITVSRIQTAVIWLQRAKKISRDVAMPQETWKEEIVEHWKGVTKSKKDPVVSRPRHTREQLQQLLAVAADVDPRLELLLQLGAEYRLGQVVRCARTDLEVEKGTLLVAGSGHKGGELVLLTEGQQAAVRRALGGYLRALEDRFHEDGTDYQLFPSGRLLRWRQEAPTLGAATDATKPLSENWIIRNFHLAEDLAGIPRLSGRAAYGLRRAGVDAANGEGISREGMKAHGGWSSSKIADEVYADQENQRGREEAKRVRAKIRGEK
jgi:hypothetical protein